MKTYEKLAVELRKLGLEEMALKADKGHYHDFLSHLDFPSLQLALDLVTAANAAHTEALRHDILALRNRVIDGDFDADLAESDEWAASADGQAAFALLKDVLHG